MSVRWCCLDRASVQGYDHYGGVSGSPHKRHRHERVIILGALGSVLPSREVPITGLCSIMGVELNVTTGGIVCDGYPLMRGRARDKRLACAVVFLPRFTFWQSKFPPEPTFREQGPDRQVLQKDVFKVLIFIRCREGVWSGVSFASLPWLAQQPPQRGPPTSFPYGPYHPLTCPMAPFPTSQPPNPVFPAMVPSLVPRRSCSSRASRVRASDRWQQLRKAVTQVGP